MIKIRRKEFWPFVCIGRRTKGEKNITSLKSDNTAVSLKVQEVIGGAEKHYQLLGKMIVDSVFDADWKEEVEDRVSSYSSLSEEAGVSF